MYRMTPSSRRACARCRGSGGSHDPPGSDSSRPARSRPEPGQTVADGPSSGGVSRFVIVLAVTGTILLAFGAFWFSFTTLRDLAVLSGIAAEAGMDLAVDRGRCDLGSHDQCRRAPKFSESTARRFAWLLFAAGAGVPSPRTSPTR